jgi:polar amino acid transport system permease protein
VKEKQLRFTWFDIILSLIIVGAVFFVFYRIKSGLNYKWRWEVLPQYILRRDSMTGTMVPGLLMEGFFVTLKISIWSTLAATIIGIIMGIIRSGSGIFSRIAGALYVEIIRNIPPIVLVFIFYFFFSSYLIEFFHLEEWTASLSPAGKKMLTVLFVSPHLFSSFISAVITMSIYEGAYITEIVRAGINSVARGQWEAARALGLSPNRILKHIILPQALRNILPPLAGQFISVIKDSAIVSVISIQELTFQGLEIMASTYLTFEIWITITIFYFILTFTCSIAFEKVFIYFKRK